MEQSVESGKETSPVTAAETVATVEAPAAATATAEAAPEKIRMSFRESLAAIASPLAARPRLSRFTVLALAIAVAAAAGSAVGAMAAVAFVKPQPVSSDDARTIEVNALRGVITQLSAEVASLKASIDSNSKSANAQMAKVAERVEKAQAEPASRVQKLSELLERIDRRTAATAASSSDVTGSIASSSAAPAASKQSDRPAVVSGWVIRDVFDGRAMLENARLGFYEVVPGADLPGVGRVQTIRRQDGRWVVVTPKGLIVSSR
ncbi:hypothetical protein [Pseudorhodoplanes sinuspersici]|uniref:Uncharacterized protein n=1 Tax=Pseudorhodoplanes sinuspersici TaxID=1235591 RepID=A0A1W6ZPE9_9HYPH|nr:hypothetical protein [Pseudorhodoplanes sinuspersici]ARP99249.1 hypothetical protein CAK95_09255 [Pseudorhodoplanes sinuspersici]RKE69076.1 hypothetical protein DFP91_3502 [Pseudorhodoplanes sinuspersici]